MDDAIGTYGSRMLEDILAGFFTALLLGLMENEGLVCAPD